MGSAVNILFSSAQPYLPQVSGGAQTSTHEIMIELMKLDHQVSMLSGLLGSGWLGLRDRIQLKLTGAKAVRDDLLAYPVYRGWVAAPAAPGVVDKVRPDVAVIPTSKGVPLGRAFQKLGVPVVVYLRDVEFHELDGSLEELPGAVYVANSQFTADRYHSAFGVTAQVIPPLFQRDFYVTPTTGDYVTFINPHRHKGAELALDLAALCPDIPFCFVSGWVLPEGDAQWLAGRLAHLPNVVLKPRTSTIRDVYARTRILLAPSRWEEGWGRVVSEAHFSGIPALASAVGGLPESVGPGGVLIDRDAPVQVWADALNDLWRNAATYDALSQAALAFAGRPQLDPKQQIASLLGVLQQAVDSHAGAAA
jgi:glycosyltransferase involved in cell wall biosynthesis